MLPYVTYTFSSGGCYCVKYIGATKEEYRGESWYAGYQNGKGTSLYNEKSQDSFWERRAEQKKRIEAQVREQQEKKRIQKEAYEKAAMEKGDMHRRLMSQRAKEAAFTDSVSTKSAGTVSKANDAYEANFLLAESSLI